MLGSLLVRPAFLHDAGVRRFVHRLKYAAADGIPPVLLDAMVARLPPDAGALIPVPRAMVRILRYGSDPAQWLARELSACTGIPAVAALATPLMRRSQAQRRRAARTSPQQRAIRPVPAGAVLIDDVVTTGRTLIGAAAVLEGVRIAVTLTTSDWQ